jgi:hypothetical protein
LICLVSGILWFFPAKIQEKLHTKTPVDNFGLYVGLAFIASAALLALNIFIWTYSCGTRVPMKWRWRRDLSHAIARLDQGEVAVLREFFIQGKQSLMLPVDEPTVAGLISKGMIGRISNIGRQWIAGVLFPVAIDPDLYDALCQHPQNLGMPVGEPTRAEIDRVTSERPAFMREVARLEAWRSGF